MRDKILIVDGPGYGRAIQGLGRLVADTKEFIKNPKDFCLVLFSGGEDICPDFYGHTSPKHLCGYFKQRDVREKVIFDIALKNEIAMTGICRGSQFLNVMSGGTLIHHLDNHGTNHVMENYRGERITVTSTHHQMCIPTKEGFVVGWSEEKRSSRYFGDKDELFDYVGPEVEAIYYPKNKIFAVQYHPEYMPEDSDGYKWFKQGVVDLLSLQEEAFKHKYVHGKGLSTLI